MQRLVLNILIQNARNQWYFIMLKFIKNYQSKTFPIVLLRILEKEDLAFSHTVINYNHAQWWVGWRRVLIFYWCKIVEFCLLHVGVLSACWDGLKSYPFVWIIFWWCQYNEKKDLVEQIEKRNGKAVVDNHARNLCHQVEKQTETLGQVISAREKIGSELIIVKNVSTNLENHIVALEKLQTKANCITKEIMWKFWKFPARYQIKMWRILQLGSVKILI